MKFVLKRAPAQSRWTGRAACKRYDIKRQWHAICKFLQSFLLNAKVKMMMRRHPSKTYDGKETHVQVKVAKPMMIFVATAAFVIQSILPRRYRYQIDYYISNSPIKHYTVSCLGIIGNFLILDHSPPNLHLPVHSLKMPRDLVMETYCRPQSPRLRIWPQMRPSQWLRFPWIESTLMVEGWWPS